MAGDDYTKLRLPLDYEFITDGGLYRVLKSMGDKQIAVFSWSKPPVNSTVEYLTYWHSRGMDPEKYMPLT
ncbi:hypothetical protein A3K63_01410 [Candidatus Micrarchaeota archaeon RBG_16_49_10]|nr:MAG: hypothetical protein A3K63_01410 [Candidatus Micrarchaeota archaeon RBG_16_49_10]